jgi:hypothetical protein
MFRRKAGKRVGIDIGSQNVGTRMREGESGCATDACTCRGDKCAFAVQTTAHAASPRYRMQNDAAAKIMVVLLHKVGNGRVDVQRIKAHGVGGEDIRL